MRISRLRALLAAMDFFPRRCVLCRSAFAPGRAALCPDCYGRIAERVAEAPVVCPVCLRHRPVLADGICADCQTENSVPASSLAHYEEPYTRLIHLFKYGGVALLARDLGELLALGSGEIQGEYLVTWVPLSFRRWLMRGYNQAHLLARAFAHRRGFASLALLRKARHNRAQASLGSRGRRQNARGAYTLRAGASVQGKRVLLVDDVLTTGATSGACAEILLAAGAAEVHVLTLCCG